MAAKTSAARLSTVVNIQPIDRQTHHRDTGANSGIGWHTALELGRAGTEVTSELVRIANSWSEQNELSKRGAQRG
jgi:hypothetical protein